MNDVWKADELIQRLNNNRMNVRLLKEYQNGTAWKIIIHKDKVSEISGYVIDEKTGYIFTDFWVVESIIELFNKIGIQLLEIEEIKHQYNIGNEFEIGIERGKRTIKNDLE